MAIRPQRGCGNETQSPQAHRSRWPSTRSVSSAGIVRGAGVPGASSRWQARSNSRRGDDNVAFNVPVGRGVHDPPVRVGLGGIDHAESEEPDAETLQGSRGGVGRLGYETGKWPVDHIDQGHDVISCECRRGFRSDQPGTDHNHPPALMQLVDQRAKAGGGCVLLSDLESWHRRARVAQARCPHELRRFQRERLCSVGGLDGEDSVSNSTAVTVASMWLMRRSAGCPCPQAPAPGRSRAIALKGGDGRGGARAR